MPNVTRAGADGDSAKRPALRRQQEVLSDPLGADPLGGDPLVRQNASRQLVPPASGGEEAASPAEPGLLARTWEGVKHGGQVVGEGIADAGHAIKQGASEAWDATKQGASEAWDATKQGVSSAGKAVKSGAIATAESMKHGAVIGAGVGAAGGLAVGGLAGGTAGALGAAAVAGPDGDAITKSGKVGGAVGGGILAVPSAIVGGLVGAVAGPLVRGVDALRSDDKALLKKTAKIPAQHVMMEQLAHHYAYGRGDLATLAEWGYEIAGEHEDANSGFRVVAFAPRTADAKGPDGSPLRPVVAFRGTANAGGAQDDANTQGVGTFQFSRNEKEIEGVIKSAKGTPDVTGHSLGGALAQLAAARFGGLVGNVVTFQSPGINAAEAMRIDKDKHQATHYRAKGDVVSDAGEAFAPGELFTFEHKGPNSPLMHLTFPLAELNALRKKHDMDTPIVSGVRSEADSWESGGAHHQGQWGDAESPTKSKLLVAKHDTDVQQGPTTGITDILSLGKGRQVSEPVRAMAGAETGISDRQSAYAAAWREIRAVCMTVQKGAQIPGVRSRVVDLCIAHKVSPKDHAKFISQAEAAMLTALEASPFNTGGPITA